MKEKLKELTPYYGFYDFWKSKVQRLEKKDIQFNVIDLDDTIFSVSERVNSHKMFKENRAEKGNLLITNELGIEKITKKWYKGKDFPKEIISSVNIENTLILTAGIREYQEEKIMHLGLKDFNMLVTNIGKDKIIELIRYIIFDLKFIPSEINIYEDRPEYFLEYKNLIEDVLQTKLNIYYVEMNGNRGYKKIELQK